MASETDFEELEERVERLESLHGIQKDKDEQEPEPDEATAPEPDSSSASSGNVMAGVGAVLLGLGLLFLIAYAIDQGWIGRAAQITFGVVLGAAVTGVGHWLYGKKQVQGSLLSGVGVATMYGSLFAAYVFPAYRSAIGLSFIATSSLLLLTVVIALVLAAWQDNGGLLVESLVLAFCTRFITGLTDWLNWVAFGYTAVILGASALLATKKAWTRTLTGLGVVTVLFVATLIPDAPSASPVLPAFIALFAVVFGSISLWRRHPVAGLITTATTWGLSILTFDAEAEITIGFAAASYLLAALSWYHGTNRSTAYLAGGIGLTTVWLPLQFTPAVFRPAWSVLLGLTGYAYSRRPDNVWLQRLTHVVAVPTGASLVVDATSTASTVTGSVLITAAFFFVSMAYASEQRSEAHVYYAIGVLTAMITATQHLSESWITLAWGGIGLASMLLGAWINRWVPRRAGLLVLGVAVLKLLAFDTLSLGPVWRIVSYITIGIILLGASIAYQRFSDESDTE